MTAAAPRRGFRVPAWLNPLTPWLRMNLAVSPLLREGKSLLFIELGQAAARGVPMDKALEMCARTSDEMHRRSMLTKSPRGADTRWLGLAVLIVSATFAATIAIVASGQEPNESNGYAILIPAMCVGLLMAATGMRFADTDRVARKLAISLRGAVAGGAPLSAAMARRSMFDTSEARLVEAGERWDRLPEALARLGEFQGAEARAAKTKAAVCYPLWLLVVMFSIMSFVFVTVLPKFQDVFDAIGAEMPPLTRWVMGLADVANGRPLGTLVILAGALALMAFHVRLFMNGTVFGKLMFFVPWFLLLLSRNISAFGSDQPSLMDSLGLTMVMEWWTGNRVVAYRNSPYFWTPVALVLLVFDSALHFAVLGYMLRGMEWLVLRAERGVGALLCRVPVLGAADTARGEARWMGALALGLGGGGGTAGEALRVAGGISGGWRGGASGRSAKLADAGVPLGVAVGRTGAASAYTAARLTLMEGRPDFAAALRGLADDRAAAASETTERLARVGECVAVVALGVVTGVFVVAMYMPLFEIARVATP